MKKKELQNEQSGETLYLVDDLTGLEPESIALRKAAEEASKAAMEEDIKEAEKNAETPLAESRMMTKNSDENGVSDAVLDTYDGVSYADLEEERNAWAEAFLNETDKKKKADLACTLNSFMLQKLPRMSYIQTLRDYSRVKTLIDVVVRMMAAGIPDETITTCTGIQKEDLVWMRMENVKPSSDDETWASYVIHEIIAIRKDGHV